MHKTGDLRLFYSRCLNVDDSHISICMAYRDQSRFPLRQQIFFANTKNSFIAPPKLHSFCIGENYHNANLLPR